MGKIDDIRRITTLGKFKDKQQAEDFYTNINLNFKSMEDGIFRIKQIMKKYGLSFSAAYDCALDPSQLEMLQTMAKK